MGKGNRGSLTLEAAIVLPVIMSIIFSIGFLIQIFYVHTIVQYGITETAKEIASYGYVLQKAELYDAHKGIITDSLEGKAIIGDAVDATTLGMNLASEGGGSWEQTLATIKEVAVKVKGLKEKVESSEDLFTDILLGIFGDFYTWGIDKIGEQITLSLMPKYITPDSPNRVSMKERFEALRIVNGNFSFEGSEFFTGDDTKVVKIVVTYQLEPIIPLPLLKELTITQNVTVRAWIEE